MCDYSLEMYKTTEAKQGDTLFLTRFPSGTMGFVSSDEAAREAANPGGLSMCATCLKDGTLLNLDVPDSLVPGYSAFGVFAKVDLPANAHRDGVRLADGRSISLQSLPRGTKAVVLVAADQKAPEDKDLVSPPVNPAAEPALDPAVAYI